MMRKHPDCAGGCQYAKDIGMWPRYTCSDRCAYEQATKAAHDAMAHGVGMLKGGHHVERRDWRNK